MIRINKKNWMLIFIMNSALLLICIFIMVIIHDPFFHFHKPYTKTFSYKLENQRYQNDGITKKFDYTGIITGTSMTENFMKTEADNIFGENFIKVPFGGGSFKEINDNILIGIKYNKKLKTVIRGLDCDCFLDDAMYMNKDVNSFPYYLYDDVLINDIRYIFNFDVVVSCIKLLYATIVKKQVGFVNNFDSYSYWMYDSFFGKDAVLKERNNKKYEIDAKTDIQDITIDEYKTLDENIEKNVLSAAINNPQISFYYFFTPYSAAWWGKKAEKGIIHKQIMIEKYVIEKILKQKNIYLYSFNNFYDITTNLNNYRDYIHYGEWINTEILNCMKNGVGRLTKDNYNEYLKDEEEFYSNFDYNELFNQIDESDRIPKLILDD